MSNLFTIHLLKEFMDSNTGTQEIFSITRQTVLDLKLTKPTSLDLAHSTLLRNSSQPQRRCLGEQSIILSELEHTSAYPFPHSVLFLFFILKTSHRSKTSTKFKSQCFISVSQSNQQGINAKCCASKQLNEFIRQKISYARMVIFGGTMAYCGKDLYSEVKCISTFKRVSF